MATQPAHVLAARLDLVDRLRAVEHRLARNAQAASALGLLRDQLHSLGNSIQIVELALAELKRRRPDDLLQDACEAALAARSVLREMTAHAQPTPRTTSGAEFAATIRNAVELVRPALGIMIDVRDEMLASIATCPLDADELETLVIAVLLDSHAATTLELGLRERTIDGTPWLQLVRCDDRASTLVLEPPSLLGLADQLARSAGGELSLAPGRHGHELVVALPTS
ncbi:hypothetical protein BH11MYX1_BH11MYX1_26260 [soil metagenome]